jgi:hypothetical protein
MLGNIIYIFAEHTPVEVEELVDHKLYIATALQTPQCGCDTQAAIHSSA